MPTKPLAQPEYWATDAVYTTGPFIGQPQKVVPPGAFAAEGHRPGSLFPTPAEYENSQQNGITGLARWTFAGTYNPDADAHIVETDATGRAGLHGLTVTDLVDETAVQVSGANTVAPTLTVQCSTDATRIQASLGVSNGTGYDVDCGIGTCVGYSAVMTASPGTGVSVQADAATSGRPLLITNAGSGATADFRSNLIGGTTGVYMQSQRGVCLTLDAQGPLATTLRMIPRAVAAAATGATWIDSTSGWVEFYDQTTTRKRVWSSSAGITMSPSTYTAATATFAGTQVVQSLNFTFVSGQRYRITMCCRLGRAAGSTRDAQISAQVGGVGLNYSGQQVLLFQAGAAGQLETSWIGDDVFTAGVSGTLAVTLSVTPINGAGSVNAAQRSIVIVGAYD